MRFPRRGRCIKPRRELPHSGPVGRRTIHSVLCGLECAVWGVPHRWAPQVVFRRKKLCWQGLRRLLKFSCCSWASSSAGRAPRSQRGGRGFESPLVHQTPSQTNLLLGHERRLARGIKQWAGGACRHLLLVRKRKLTAKRPSRRGGGPRSAYRWAGRSPKRRTVRTRQDFPPPKCSKPISSRRCSSPFSHRQFPWGSAGLRQREALDLRAEQKSRTLL